MNTYTIHFIGQPDSEPKTATLPGIPRVGDEFDFHSVGKYGVRRVAWDIAASGGPTIFICLTLLDETGRA